MRSKKLKEIRRRVEMNQLQEGDQELIAELLQSYVKLIASVKDSNTTLEDLEEHFRADEKGFMAVEKITSMDDDAAESRSAILRPGNGESSEQGGKEKDQERRQ
jgi:hypothetical protein